VIDDADEDQAAAVQDLDVEVAVTDTIMRDDRAAELLATVCLDLGRMLAARR
jgi:hypothetical protein